MLPRVFMKPVMTPAWSGAISIGTAQHAPRARSADASAIAIRIALRIGEATIVDPKRNAAHVRNAPKPR